MFFGFFTFASGVTRMRAVILVVVLAVGVLPTMVDNAFGCGESMFRVGKGVHYRAYSAPIPGSVLVYARTNDEREVAQQLADAGHNVMVVSNDVDLALEMQNRQFDVVVAPYSKRDEVEMQSEEIASHPDWVLVVESGTPEAKAAKAQNELTVSTDSDIRKYLKAIHRSLKAQGT